MSEEHDEIELAETKVVEVRDENETEPHSPQSAPAKKKKKLSKAGVMLFRVILAVSIAVAAYSGFQLYKGLKDYRESENTYSALATETSTEKQETVAEDTGTTYTYDKANFTALAEINPDVAGWLSLENTVINYPVVQGTDNEYYLEHLFTRETNHTGCIFVDYRNAKDFSDRNTAMYAHHMRNGSMFAELEGYREQDYYETHKELILQTPSGVYLIQPFSGLLADGYTDYVQFDFPTDESFMTYINDLIAKSTFKSDVTVTAEDRIVTMSTCRYDVTNGRYAVFGKLVKID
jgi:sortase B